jgi:hypothetical protein
MRTAPTRRTRRTYRAPRTRHAIPCIAVVLTLGDAAQRWIQREPVPSYRPCAAVADERATVRRPNDADSSYVIRPGRPHEPAAGSGATSSTSVTSR